MKIIYNYATRELPVGFVRLDYIESTGTQWIDTGLTSFCDFEIMSQVSEGQPNKTFGNTLACLERRNAANPHWQLLFSQGGTVYSSVSVYNKTKNSLRNGVWKVNDETVATLDFDYYIGTVAYLFAVDTVSSYPQKIFYLKTWDKQGNMTRNFIPCYRYSDGIEGLYDTVGKQFYTNQGTGRFLRGKEIDSGNLLDLSKFTRGYPSNTAFENTTKRTFTENTYVIGIARNNYYSYNPAKQSTTISDQTVIYSAIYGHGTGLVKKLRPNTTYRLHGEISSTTTNGVFGIMYYASDGTFISSDDGNLATDITFTTISDFAYSIIALIPPPATGGTITFSNISLHEVN